MQSIRQVARLNELELEKVVPPNASWHTDYRDTAYIYVGGLPFDLSEGDILTIFSQYGNPAHINLVRDKETGKSRGFCFLKYEDQRSCDLAVDNLSGAGVMGRVVSVDHTRYKRKEGEVETLGEDLDEGDGTDGEGEGGRKRRRTESGSGSGEERPMIREEVELAQLVREVGDDDPMKAYLVKEKKAEVEEALKVEVAKKKPKARERKHKHKHHHHRSWRDVDDEDEDGDRRRNGHGSRRERSDSEDERDGRRRHHGEEGRNDAKRCPNDESHSEDDRPRRRREDERPSRRRRDDSEPERSRSRERHRRR